MGLDLEYSKYYVKPSAKSEARLTKLKYKHMEPNKSVVVLGGGPSTLEDKDLINDYIEKNNSTVIGTNYPYPFISKMDYVYFGDPGKFRTNLKNVSCGIFIAVSIVDKYNQEFWSQVEDHHACYEVFNRHLTHGNDIKRWSINENGTFPTSKYGPSGLAVMCMSLLFKPEEILVSGLDGPMVTRQSKLLKKTTYNGKTKTYGSLKKYKTRKRALGSKVVRLLQEKSVEIKCVPSSAFWNISKKKYGITSI
jgi:hypothetical protein